VASHFILVHAFIIFVITMQLITRLRSGFFRVVFMTLAAIYLLFSVGVMKATHICMGREASVTFFSADSKKCPCSLFSMESNTCCDDEHDVLRIKDDQKVFSAYTIRVPQLYILEDLYTEQFIAALVTDSVIETDSESDPSPPKVPIFKSNCSFVFYDSEIKA
jgi:hypothetical protein